MVRNLILIPVLLLGSCERLVYSSWSSEKTAERADIANANARNAMQKITSLEERLSDLEQRIDDAEREAETEARTRKAVDTAIADGVDSLSEKHNILVKRVYGDR